MVKVAKALIIDDHNRYLLLKRNNHPRFGNDPDLPGGTVEAGETPLAAMVREVSEEVGIILDFTKAKELYSGTDYSMHHTEYTLYEVKLTNTPDVTLSWEHATFTWLERKQFLEIIKSAPDTYMQMVYDILQR